MEQEQQPDIVHEAIADIKDTLLVRAAHIGRCLDQHREVLEEFNVRLSRMEDDFAIVKEYLVSQMRQAERR